MPELQCIRRFEDDRGLYTAEDVLSDSETHCMATTSKGTSAEMAHKKSSCLDEAKSLAFYRDAVQEIISTFVLVSVQCAVLTDWDGSPEDPSPVDRVQVALVMGTTVIAMIEAFSAVGGAHMNPAISIGFVASRRLSVLKALVYVISQLLGAVAGSYFIYALTPASHLREGYAVTFINKDMAVWQGLLVEIWLTATFLAVIHGTSDRRRHPYNMFSIPIGMFVITAVLLAGYTGSSINPARSFGPALCTSNWKDHWVYWVGPITGGVIGSVIYEYILDKPDRHEASKLHISETEGPASRMDVSGDPVVSETNMGDTSHT